MNIVTNNSIRSNYISFDHTYKGRYTHTYDALNRRISETKDGVTTQFIWDGNNLFSEITSEESTFYVWGLDMSETLQGAGGVGGLLWQVNSQGTSLPLYDNNGNIMKYVSLTGGVKGSFTYDAFLNVTATNLQDSFRFQASTKSWNNDLGLLEYQFRAYSPSLGRWIQEDPIQEQGGINLYNFVYNNPINYIDKLGFVPITREQWTVSGYISDGSVVGWNYSFDAELNSNTNNLKKCELVYTATIQFVATNSDLGEKAFMKFSAWRNAISSYMNKWKLVSNDESCTCCSEIYITFKIKLLGLNNKGENISVKNKDYIVNIEEGNGRSNLGKLYFGNSGVSVSPFTTVVHEIGHAYGLTDEYLDQKYYPEKTEESLPDDYPKSIMHYPISGVFLHRHMEEILYRRDNILNRDSIKCSSYTLERK